jgi:hypothetical protein
MEDLATLMEQDVAIVSVFGLKEVHHKAVGCQTSHKTILCVGEILPVINLKELF